MRRSLVGVGKESDRKAASSITLHDGAPVTQRGCTRSFFLENICRTKMPRLAKVAVAVTAGVSAVRRVSADFDGHCTLSRSSDSDFQERVDPVSRTVYAGAYSGRANQQNTGFRATTAGRIQTASPGFYSPRTRSSPAPHQSPWSTLLDCLCAAIVEFHRSAPERLASAHFDGAAKSELSSASGASSQLVLLQGIENEEKVRRAVGEFCAWLRDADCEALSVLETWPRAVLIILLDTLPPAAVLDPQDPVARLRAKAQAVAADLQNHRYSAIWPEKMLPMSGAASSSPSQEVPQWL